ncbi:MAG: thioesterase family protein [Solirubrobacterales bacterium]
MNAPELAPGLETVETFNVDERLVTDVEGALSTPVLSTPGMIERMEAAANALAVGSLPEGKATVGFEVSVKHVGAAPEGSTCKAKAVLREVVDGRKLRFEVEVTFEDRVIGVGTHERRVVDIDQLG